MAKVKDVVCNCEIEEAHAHKKEYKGNTYYFCTPTCKASFEDNPEKYVK